MKYNPRYILVSICLLALGALFVHGPLAPVPCQAEEQVPSTKVVLFPLKGIGPKDRIGQAVSKVEKALEDELSRRGHVVIRAEEAPPSGNIQQLRQVLASHGALFGINGTVSLLGSHVSIDLYVISRDSLENKPLTAFIQGPMEKLAALSGLLTDKIEQAFLTPYLIARVQVEGNRRVGSDAIFEELPIRKGMRYDPKIISESIRAMYKMGYFDDIEADVQDTPEGKVVTFLVREKPAIRKIKIVGNKELEEDKIREVLDLRPYTVIKEQALQENAQKIQMLYSDKGFAGTTVVAAVKPVSNQAADVIFEITEGEKVKIKKIEFQGNKAFSDDDLKGIMEVAEEKPWWTPSLRNIIGLIKGDAGILKNDALERDLARLAAYYHNHGYVDAKVGRPKIKRDGADIYITIPINEGERYGVGKIRIEQDYFKDVDKLLEELKLKDNDYFSQQILRKDIMALTSHYSDHGFAYCNITPIITKDPEKKVVNITLKVDKGPKVYIDRIEIAGNTRTRDKVIRRELRVKELEPFSSSGLKKSQDRLRRLGYFEDVNITPKKGRDKAHMDIDVQVKERQTGTFSIGAGYSSVDSLIFMGEISQRNFLGKGQTLSFKGILGASTQRYTISFLEPYFRDTRFSLGFDLYNWEYEYDDYTKKSWGGALRFGYPITDNLRWYAGFRMDYTDLEDYGWDSSRYIQDSKDIKTTRALSTGLVHDTRNRFFNPSRGWLNDISLEYAGGVLGGDAEFVKLEGSTSYYHSIWKELVGHIKFGAGYVKEGSNGKLPVWERFFLGGLDSIRGYKYGWVSPIDPETDERIGGEYMGYMQSELIFPLIQGMGLNGVIFYDMGNVWEKGDIDLTDTRKSVGFGIRWLSPMGPLRIEYGYNIDKQPDDDKSNWEFRMGGSF